MVPQALYTNLSHQSYRQGFYAFCTIFPAEDTSNPSPLYLDSLWVADSLEPWQSTDICFSQWSSPVGEFVISFHASGQNFCSPTLSTTFYWTGIDEEPVSVGSAEWFLAKSMGREIVIDCSSVSCPREIRVYDACGRKIDHIRIASRPNRVTWGADAPPGIYFLVDASESPACARKAVILR
jgi:hypothetical protein